MTRAELLDCLERSPIIAAVRNDLFEQALESPSEVLFHLGIRLPDAPRQIAAAHEVGKRIFVHIDLAEGIGKDACGVEYLASQGVDGIISTRRPIIHFAKEHGLLTVQRFFALDSQGVAGIPEMLRGSEPDLMEIMPGVAANVIRRFAAGEVPVIAGGLVETKADVTTALQCGAAAVSTGKTELWYI